MLKFSPPTVNWMETKPWVTYRELTGRINETTLQVRSLMASKSNFNEVTESSVSAFLPCVFPEIQVERGTYTGMVFCYQNFLTYCEKKIVPVSRKTFEIWGWRPRICKFFEITETIYSNSERSEQFLVTEWFLTT